MPSGSTFYRTVRSLDLAAREAHVADWAESLVTEMASAAITTSEGKILEGQSLDGKEVHGSHAHGQPLTLVQHGTGIPLAPVETDMQSNEIPAAAPLLAGRDLTNTVMTMDALHTQPDLAQQTLINTDTGRQRDPPDPLPSHCVTL